MEEFVFCRCFEGWSCGPEVNSLSDRNVISGGNADRHIDKFFIVRLAHIGEAGAYPAVVSANQGIGDQINMIPYYHYVADMEFGIHASGGI